MADGSALGFRFWHFEFVWDFGFGIWHLRQGGAMGDRGLMDGNEAICRGAIAAGCRGYFGYPITPQNEIPEFMSREMPKIGGVFVQSESETASINMVYGGALAGRRG